MDTDRPASVDLPDYLTTAEVAVAARTVPSTVRYWRLQGRGPRGVLVGRQVLYERAAVIAWLRSLDRGAA